MRLSRPLLGLATVAVLATGALSGCGIADAEVRPGTAAVVEGEEISLSDVDDATEATCEVLQGSQELLAGGFTGAELRGIVVQQLVVTEVAEAWAPYLTMTEGIRIAAKAFGADVSKLSCCA